MLYIVIGILIQLLSSYSIVFFQRIIDESNQIVSLDVIVKLILLYGLFTGFLCILNYVNEYPRTKLNLSIFEKIRIFSIEKISRISYSAYQKIGTGEMIKIIENGADSGRNIVFSFYLRLLSELIPTIIINIIFVGIYSTNIMLVVLIGYIFIFLITKVVLGYMYKIKNALLEKQESMSKFSVRSLMELVVFRINKRYRKEIERLNNTADDMVNANCRLVMIHEFFFAFFAFLIIIVKVVVLYMGVRNIVSGNTTIGIIYAMISFLDKIYNPIAIFNVLYVQYKLDRVTFNHFKEFYSKPDDKNLYEGKKQGHFHGDIEISDLQFKYDNHEFIKGLSFYIEKNSTVAIVGESGGGKSTIIKLILGLLKKQQGKILLDGVDIDSVCLDSYYNHISYISQDAPIFDASIKENLVFDSDISEERIYECLDMVLLKQKVDSMEGKLNAQVGEKGVQLSGGERQRLAMARVLLQNRKLVILDEPISALDAISEKRVMDNLIRYMNNKTLIIIAHRLQTIQNADKIIVFKKGHIDAQGDFQYLMKNSPYFVELWQKSNYEGNDA
ncbi:MAG: ABC transporter ATP-binding protein/permease [Clostridiales bacterium]|nr:ABC transporter ATP-binding protein/permease [Clostridiales bacterium]